MNKPKNINFIIKLYKQLNINISKKRQRCEFFDPNPREYKRRKINV